MTKTAEVHIYTESSKMSHNKQLTMPVTTDNWLRHTDKGTEHRTKKKMQHASACMWDIRWSQHQANDYISRAILTRNHFSSADCYDVRLHSHWLSVLAALVPGAATKGPIDN